MRLATLCDAVDRLGTVLGSVGLALATELPESALLAALQLAAGLAELGVTSGRGTSCPRLWLGNSLPEGKDLGAM